MLRLLQLALIASLLAGCATAPLPPEAAEPSTSPRQASLAAPANAPDLSQVRTETSPSAYRNRQVRWSGRVVGPLDTPSGTLIEVLAKPSTTSGLPQLEAASLGRFLVRPPGAAGSTDFTPQYAVTVLGRIEKKQLIRSAELYYLAPIVAAEAYQLWHPEQLPFDPDQHAKMSEQQQRGWRIWPQLGIGIGYGSRGGWRGRYGIGISIFP